MEFVKLVFQGKSYDYKDSTNIKMCILGCFFSSDVSCDSSFYKEWALNDPNLSACGNITSLSKINGSVYLSDLYSEEKAPTEIKMTIQQFVQLLDDWRDKVCAKNPKEVIIKYENGQFIIETKD